MGSFSFWGETIPLRDDL